MLTFSISNRSFKLDGDLLETITNYDFKVSHSNPQYRKLIYEFGEEMNFNIKQKERKSDRDRSMKKLLKSPAIMTSGVTTIFLPENPDEFCNRSNRIKLLLHEKQAGNNSIMNNNEIIGIVDKLLEYNSMSKKEHKQILNKCNLLHK